MQCFDEHGSFNVDLYLMYRWQKGNNENDKIDQLISHCSDIAEEEEDFVRGQRMRACQKRPLRKRDSEGNMVPLQPTDSLWYTIFVESSDLTNRKFHQQFCTRFRCPYHKYLELLTLLKENELFHRWLSKDATGCEASPIELLLLAPSIILVADGHLMTWKNKQL